MFPRIVLAAFAALAFCAHAAPFSFVSGLPTTDLGMASRPGPGSGVNQETEAADDFVTTASTSINSATFTGLLPVGATVSQVLVEIYRIFPLDSNTVRVPNVPTRNNSPSDVAFDVRDSSAAGELSFLTSTLGAITVLNSVDAGIFPSPGQTTGGDGPVTGTEVQFNVNFLLPFLLPAGHYFFVPEVLLGNADQHFLWLSAGTPVLPDLQTWIRNAALDPDWLRVGTDIVGGGTRFNAAFSLTGSTVPEPATIGLVGIALLALIGGCRRRQSG